MNKDILFKVDNYVFSYRVAGILINNNHVLLQTTINDPGYAFPGGHVSFGETNEETLIREFKEELNFDIKVNNLAWVGELFFPWGNKKCQQICLYYNVSLIANPSVNLADSFTSLEEIDDASKKVIFKWIDLNHLDKIEIYPINAKELLFDKSNQVKHFIYTE